MIYRLIIPVLLGTWYFHRSDTMKTVFSVGIRIPRISKWTHLSSRKKNGFMLIDFCKHLYGRFMLMVIRFRLPGTNLLAPSVGNFFFVDLQIKAGSTLNSIWSAFSYANSKVWVHYLYLASEWIFLSLIANVQNTIKQPSPSIKVNNKNVQLVKP